MRADGQGMQRGYFGMDAAGKFGYGFNRVILGWMRQGSFEMDSTRRFWIERLGY
ncbi:MAG: hypothetical protein HFI01_13590 [Lachnospiraceae bacterium]|nr:hypothetical protein [Lachnospiraceae bacterium]